MTIAALAFAARVARVGRIGDTDCEAIDEDALLAQPANALSSLGYVAVGAWIIWWGVHHARVRSSDAWLYGLAVAVTGIGSVDFHGPASDAARLFHDGTIGATVLFMVAFDIGLLRGWERSRTYGLFAALVVVLAVPLVIEPNSSIALTAVGLVALVFVEVLVIRSGHRPLRNMDGSPARLTAYGVALAALALGGIVNALSRTDAPLCDPESLFQGHGVWHLLTAIAFGAWAVAALPIHSRPSAPVVGDAA